MRSAVARLGLAAAALLSLPALAVPTGPLAQQPSTPARYLKLPKLRQQAKLQDAWRDERFTMAPVLLAKHGVDAWIMSMLEYSEDTGTSMARKGRRKLTGRFPVFFSMKDAIDFSARRRTLYLFHTQPNSSIPNPRIWIDNTPRLWTELNETLALLAPRSMCVRDAGPAPLC